MHVLCNQLLLLCTLADPGGEQTVKFQLQTPQFLLILFKNHVLHDFGALLPPYPWSGSNSGCVGKDMPVSVCLVTYAQRDTYLSYQLPFLLQIKIILIPQSSSFILIQGITMIMKWVCGQQFESTCCKRTIIYAVQISI